MEETHRELSLQGYCGALLVPATAALFDYYKKMGYQNASCLRRIALTAQGEKIAVQRISAQAYAQKRRALLPPDAVWQEGESLDFLQTLAAFYETDDGIFALQTDRSEARILELLGDAKIAPRLLAAFGCKRGELCVAGEGEPFSMFLPLKDEKPSLPRYFAFAFD